MSFYQFLRNWLIDWIGRALLVQPTISAHRKWREMVVSASTNQIWIIELPSEVMPGLLPFRSRSKQCSQSFSFYHFNVRHPVFLLCTAQSVFSFWFTDFLPNFFACSVVWPFNAETGYKSNAGESSKTIFVKENSHFLQQEESGKVYCTHA